MCVMNDTPTLTDKNWLASMQGQKPRIINEHLRDASAKGQVWRVRELLKLGAEPRHRGEITWKIAVQNGHLNVFKALVDHVEDKANPSLFAERHFLFFNAIRYNQQHIVEHMLKNQYYTNPDRRKYSEPIVAATEFNHKGLVEFLIKNNFNPHAKSDIALQTAAKKGHTELFHFFLDLGADIHTQNDNPLNLAVTNKHYDIVEYCLQNGADANNSKAYPLQSAVLNQDHRMISLLLKYKANINFGNSSAMRYAVSGGHINTIGFLLSHGASTSITKDIINLAPEDKQPIIKDFIKKYQECLKAPVKKKNRKYLNDPVGTAKLGHFEHWVAEKERRGQLIDKKTLLKKDALGNTVLDILGAKNQLSLLFKSNLWTGRLDVLNDIWQNHLAPYYKDQIDFKALHMEVSILSISKTRIRPKRRPPPTP